VGGAALSEVALEGRVPADRVIPRQPIQHDRRRIAGPAHARHLAMLRLAHIIFWVLITAWGMPVLPDVNRSLPTVSGVSLSANAASQSVP
jgi:hypothetical protein